MHQLHTELNSFSFQFSFEALQNVGSAGFAGMTAVGSGIGGVVGSMWSNEKSKKPTKDETTHLSKI